MSDIASALEKSKTWSNKLLNEIDLLAAGRRTQPQTDAGIVDSISKSVVQFTGTSYEDNIKYSTKYKDHVKSKESATKSVKSKLDTIINDNNDDYNSVQRGEKIIKNKPFPYITNLVLAGGGGKGLAYPGVYAALSECGFIKHLQKIAGSSAGALTGAAIACGADPRWLARMIRSMPYAGLMLAGRLKFDNLKVVKGTGVDSGQELYGIFRSIYRFSFIYNMQQCLSDIEGAARDGVITGDELKELVDFANDENATLTFGILRTMRKVRPDIFKDLVITGSKLEGTRDPKADETVDKFLDRFGKVVKQGPISIFDVFKDLSKKQVLILKTVYFSADTAPDMEIALAARISMSLPALFDAVALPQDDGSEWTMFDGGMTSNVPLEVMYDFLNPSGRNSFEIDCAEAKAERDIGWDFGQAMDRTMVVTPKNDGEGASAANMLGRPPTDSDGADSIEGVLQLTDEAVRYDWRKVHIAGERSVLAMPHGGISTKGFLTAKSGEIVDAQIAAFDETLAFLAKVVERKVPEDGPYLDPYGTGKYDRYSNLPISNNPQVNKEIERIIKSGAKISPHNQRELSRKELIEHQKFIEDNWEKWRADAQRSDGGYGG